MWVIERTDVPCDPFLIWRRRNIIVPSFYMISGGGRSATVIPASAVIIYFLFFINKHETGPMWPVLCCAVSIILLILSDHLESENSILEMYGIKWERNEDMAIILVSILTTFVIIPVLLIVGIIFFCYTIFAYVMFCKGLKRFLLRDNIPSRWYWFPLYNLYLMGKVVQYEVGYQSWLLENAKYILPVGWTILQFINGKWIIFFSVAYLFYKVYCYYQFGKRYKYGGIMAILSVFNLQGIGLLWISKIENDACVS